MTCEARMKQSAGEEEREEREERKKETPSRE